MDSYYSSPSYYYQPPCPLHDSYVDPYSSYHYQPYVDQASPPIVHYNNSTRDIYAQPPSSVQQIPSTSVLNSTFESIPPVGRRRRQRTIFSKDQVDILDQVFEKTPYPDIQLREQLSERLDVPEARIQVWFKNRRSRARVSTKPRN